MAPNSTSDSFKDPKIIPNKDIFRIVVGIPQNHKHIRMQIETESQGTWILHEATLAAISRDYLDILLHPTKQIIELISKKIDGKTDYADYQLIESTKSIDTIMEEFSRGLSKLI